MDAGEDVVGPDTGRARRTWPSRMRARLLADTPRSAYGVMLRGATSLALLWQGLWIAAEPRLWPTGQASPVLSVVLFLPLVAWGAMLASQLDVSARSRAWLRVADSAALFVATSALLWSTAVSADHDWGAASNLAILAAGIPGLLLGLRAASAWAAGVVLAELLTIAWVAATTTPNVGAKAFLYPANALAYGVVAISARFVLVRDAHRADAYAADAMRSESERLTAEGVALRVRDHARLLHETVLNTLTAIARGGLTSATETMARLVERCRESAGVLRELGAMSDPRPGESGSRQLLERDLADTLADLGAAGTSVHVDCDSLAGIPPQAYAALRTAAREALSNVIRHAQAESVWLTVRSMGAGTILEVVVEVRDDGIGFEPVDVSPRFGLAAAIGDTLGEVGGRAGVESAPMRGTTVRLEWRSPEAHSPSSGFRPSAAGFAIPVLAVFGLYTAGIIAFTWSEYSVPTAAAMAFAIFVALGMLVSWSSLQGSLPWWVVIVVCAASPLIYQLQKEAVGGDEGALWVSWASGTIAALFLAMAGAGPRWGWLAVVCTWLFIQGDVLGELVSPGTAIILAGALFGRSTRRNADASERSRADQLAQLSALDVARESVQGLRRRYRALGESRAIKLLEGIANGRLDPDAPDVQTTAALEERFIRTVIRVDPSIDAVHALATSLAVRARRRKVFLDIDLSGSSPSRSPRLAGSRSSLMRAVECSVPGEVARLTARSEGESLVIRLLAPISQGSRDEMLHLAVPGVVVDPSDPDDRGMLWEVRQPREATS